jgi:hypothetical protein
MLIEQQKGFKYLIVLLTGCTPFKWMSFLYVRESNAGDCTLHTLPRGIPAGVASVAAEGKEIRFTVTCITLFLFLINILILLKEF